LIFAINWGRNSREASTTPRSTCWKTGDAGSLLTAIISLSEHFPLFGKREINLCILLLQVGARRCARRETVNKKAFHRKECCANLFRILFRAFLIGVVIFFAPRSAVGWTPPHNAIEESYMDFFVIVHWPEH
jgi:hypothetical protein